MMHEHDLKSSLNILQLTDIIKKNNAFTKFLCIMSKYYVYKVM